MNSKHLTYLETLKSLYVNLFLYKNECQTFSNQSNVEAGKTSACQRSKSSGASNPSRANQARS